MSHFSHRPSNEQDFSNDGHRVVRHFHNADQVLDLTDEEMRELFFVVNKAVTGETREQVVARLSAKPIVKLNPEEAALLVAEIRQRV